MKEINASVTMLFGDGINNPGLRITVRDEDANCTFLTIEMSPEQAVKALSRLSSTPTTKAVFCGLDKIGKVHENDILEVRGIKNAPPIGSEKRKAYFDRHIIANCPEGWTPDLYDTSQGSYFKSEDGWGVRDTIRRWIEKGE